eukprot:GHVP01023447.1.p1 GENE.GHVP01023447.1~~GHVP01023447.1.p1  ORF type:complete len:102 (-),score=16.70 GHVP01023447.1:647-952(-)
MADLLFCEEAEHKKVSSRAKSSKSKVESNNEISCGTPAVDVLVVSLSNLKTPENDKRKEDCKRLVKNCLHCASRSAVHHRSWIGKMLGAALNALIFVARKD